MTQPPKLMVGGDYEGGLTPSSMSLGGGTFGLHREIVTGFSH